LTAVDPFGTIFEDATNAFSLVTEVRIKSQHLHRVLINVPRSSMRAVIG
jgi:hypothetical protein